MYCCRGIRAQLIFAPPMNCDLSRSTVSESCFSPWISFQRSQSSFSLSLSHDLCFQCLWLEKKPQANPSKTLSNRSKSHRDEPQNLAQSCCLERNQFKSNEWTILAFHGAIYRCLIWEWAILHWKHYFFARWHFGVWLQNWAHQIHQRDTAYTFLVWYLHQMPYKSKPWHLSPECQLRSRIVSSRKRLSSDTHLLRFQP